MEKEHPLLKGELLLTTVTYKKRSSVWLWIGLQVLLGCLCMLFENLFHLRYHKILPFHWMAIIGLLYWQIRSSKMTGMEIILESGFVSKWTVIEVGGWPELDVVYKTGVSAEGNVTITVWPFTPTRYKMLNSMKFVIIKFAVWARIIQ